MIRNGMDQRAVLIAADPEAFFFTDHYAKYPAMLIQVSSVRDVDLVDLIEDAWRELAPKRVVAANDAAGEE